MANGKRETDVTDLELLIAGTRRPRSLKRIPLQLENAAKRIFETFP